MQILISNAPVSDLTDPQEITRTWGIVFEEFEKYYTPIIADRQKCPRADLASIIANGKIDGGADGASRAHLLFRDRVNRRA